MGLQAEAPAVRRNHPQFSACRVHTPQRKPRQFHQRHVRVSCLEIWNGLGVSARSAAGLSGYAPCRLCRHGPFGFNPSRLRACGAARFACLQGKALRAIPAARCLAPLDAAEPAAPDRHGPRPAATDGALANTLALAAAGCAGACRPQRWRCLPITSRRRFTDNPPGIAMELPRHASRAAPQGAAGAFSPVVGWLTWPASAGEPAKPSGGDAESAPSPFGAVRPKASLSRCESWRGAAAPRASWLQPSGENNFPAAARLPRAANSFRLQALHCVSTASGAASPSPAGRITTRTRWARTLFNRK